MCPESTVNYVAHVRQELTGMIWMVHSFKWNYAGCILDPLENNYIYLQSSVSVLQMYNNVLDHQIKFLLHPTVWREKAHSTVQCMSKLSMFRLLFKIWRFRIVVGIHWTILIYLYSVLLLAHYFSAVSLILLYIRYLKTDQNFPPCFITPDLYCVQSDDM